MQRPKSSLRRGGWLWLVCLLAGLLAAASLVAQEPEEAEPTEAEREAILDEFRSRVFPDLRTEDDGHLLMTFYVLGDSRPGGERDLIIVTIRNDDFDTAVLSEMIDEIVADIERDRGREPTLPSFVFHTGDMVRRGSDKGEWEHFRRSIYDLVRRADLNVSVLPILGNHEYSGTNENDPYEVRLAQYFETFGGDIEGYPVVKEDALRQLFTREKPARWYHLRCRNTEFIVLESDFPYFCEGAPPGGDGLPTQFAHLREWLMAIDPAEVQNVFIFQHHPIFSNIAKHPGTGNESVADPETGERYRTSEMAQWILCRRLLQNVLNEFYEAKADHGLRLRAMFVGHNHSYERIVIPPAHVPGWESISDLGGTYLSEPEDKSFSDYITNCLHLGPPFSAPEDMDVAFLDRDVRFITSGGAGAPHRKKGGLFGGGERTHAAIPREKKDEYYEKSRLDRWFPDYYRYRFVHDPEAEYAREVSIVRAEAGDFVPVERIDWVRKLDLLDNRDMEGIPPPFGELKLDHWRRLFSNKIPDDTEQYHFVKVRVYEHAIHFDTFLKYGGLWVVADSDRIGTLGPGGEREILPGG